jgi:hypothetical protein
MSNLYTSRQVAKGLTKKARSRGGKDNLPRMILEELAEYVIEMFK